MKKNTVIFDLDGTLANIEARRVKSLMNGKMNWDVFFDAENIQLDLPNKPVIKMAQLFKQDGFKIIIFSGRNDRSFFATKDWLKCIKFPLTCWL